MLTRSECAKISSQNIRMIFGVDYLKNNKDKIVLSVGDNAERYLCFIGFKTYEDTPNIKSNYKGWTVYADFYVEKESGRIINRDYQTE